MRRVDVQMRGMEEIAELQGGESGREAWRDFEGEKPAGDREQGTERVSMGKG